MKPFIKLGEVTEKRWRDKNYNEDVFPSIAADVLREMALPSQMSAWEVMDWTLGQTQLPEQQDLPGRFGDPPITIYNAPRFHIDVYFWLTDTTSIHQHGFCGAFQVLEGSSLHSWYEFDCQEKINVFMEVGSLNLKSCDLLNVGDVHEIWAGKPYIHALFHLAQPSVTICVRTNRSPLYLPQFDYHKPCLAMDPFFQEANTMKKLQCLMALFQVKHPDTDKYVREMLAKADFHSTYTILRTVGGYLNQNQIDNMFDPDAPRDRFNQYLDTSRNRHGELIDILPQVFDHQRWQTDIVNRRQFIADAEQRFFLALLLNVEAKGHIFQLIKKRFPDDDPIEKVLDWTYDLSSTRVMGMKTPNALGVESFDDFDLFVLEQMLKDRSKDEISNALKIEFPSAGISEFQDKIPERMDKLKAIKMLCHLTS